jgi:hypothetical protein
LAKIIPSFGVVTVLGKADGLEDLSLVADVTSIGVEQQGDEFQLAFRGNASLEICFNEISKFHLQI